MSDRWLNDVTLFGPASKVRDGVEAWRATGVKTVIVVPSSARGNQMVAFDQLIAAFRVILGDGGRPIWEDWAPRHPGAPESAGAALGRRQLLHLDQLHGLHGLHHELRDALAALDGDGGARIVVDEQHLHFAAIPGVDQPRRVEHRDAVAERETRAGKDETGEARRDRDRQSGGDGGARPRRDHDPRGGVKVESRVRRARVAREREVGIEPLHGDAQGSRHWSWCADSSKVGR